MNLSINENFYNLFMNNSDKIFLHVLQKEMKKKKKILRIL